ncbi:hypothetical protein Pyrfu_0699 [Pyrolobus fumarii 1A]|uniref:Uncharacterized protein n=1 Tax=Pyrolobus fumarii (strain DSM 11204 / 1A) TaxID=694429 RepID=G0ED09_PYRF1|nr:hypothetical protein [Pyrolobus fumarii]AEM38568.1 hypothetical protein Pyrfu_0699 [Pyrolobus fumarii 1A]
MAWRDILSRVVQASVEKAASCEGEGCGALLVAAADAIYAPLAPVDAGSGELKRLASRLASIVVHSFVYNALPKGIDGVRAALEEVERITREKQAVEKAKEILGEVGVTLEPSPAEEPRHAVINSLRYYVEAYEEAMSTTRRRRKARPPSQQDAVRHIRRLLREIGRTDPFLAKMIANILRSVGLPA